MYWEEFLHFAETCCVHHVFIKERFEHKRFGLTSERSLTANGSHCVADVRKRKTGCLFFRLFKLKQKSLKKGAIERKEVRLGTFLSETKKYGSFTNLKNWKLARLPSIRKTSLALLKKFYLTLQGGFQQRIIFSIIDSLFSCLTEKKLSNSLLSCRISWYWILSETIRIL